MVSMAQTLCKIVGAIILYTVIIGTLFEVVTEMGYMNINVPATSSFATGRALFLISINFNLFYFIMTYCDMSQCNITDRVCDVNEYNVIGADHIINKELDVKDFQLAEAPHLVFYNRVPKCGSTTARIMFESLSRMSNSFVHYASTKYHSEDLSITEQVFSFNIS